MVSSMFLCIHSCFALIFFNADLAKSSDHKFNWAKIIADFARHSSGSPEIHPFLVIKYNPDPINKFLGF